MEANTSQPQGLPAFMQTALSLLGTIRDKVVSFADNSARLTALSKELEDVQAALKQATADLSTARQTIGSLEKSLEAEKASAATLRAELDQATAKLKDPKFAGNVIANQIARSIGVEPIKEDTAQSSASSKTITLADFRKVPHGMRADIIRSGVKIVD